MKISIFGLGYVGAVSAGCLAAEGHTVIGVDPNSTKVELINAGKAPIIEKDLGELIESGVSQGLLSATTDVYSAVENTELSIVCVGTPSQSNGSLDLTYVRRVCQQIGEALKSSQSFHVVVARSTMLPGSMMDAVIPTLEQASGKKAGIDFGVCNNPEFLRESTAVYDFYHPPKTVIGETDERGGAILASLYEKLDAPMIRTDVATAEMVKYTDNVWHALKVGFANEIGSICKEVGIDSHAVMDIFCQDTKLNLSSYYMKPGFAFGGSCLPKDVRAMTHKAKTLDLDLPILNGILPSNRNQVERGLELIMAQQRKKIGVLGFSFKAGTDDLRESPLVEVIERLLGKGFDIKIYDKNVRVASLVGANKDFILNHIPHISSLMTDNIEQVMEHAEVIVIGNGSEEFKTIPSQLREGQQVIDLVRVGPLTSNDFSYQGVSW